jgi:hypothetical protein
VTSWHVARWLAVSWSLLTAIFLVVIAVGILTQPAFPLGLGGLRATGLAGLWFTLLPAALAIAGAVIFGDGRRLAAGLLAAYSVFWAGAVASALPLVWNARRSFCLDSLGVCITSPWLGRLTTIALLAAFALAALWFGRVLAGRRAPAAGA